MDSVSKKIKGELTHVTFQTFNCASVLDSYYILYPLNYTEKKGNWEYIQAALDELGSLEKDLLKTMENKKHSKVWKDLDASYVEDRQVIRIC